MNPIWFVLEGSVVGFVDIYCILAITENKRFPNWVSYVLGITFSFLCGYNNSVYQFANTSILFYGLYLFIFLALSKDRLIKRILIFLVYSALNIPVEICAEIFGVATGISAQEYSLRLEILRSFTSTVLCSLCIIVVLIYKRKKIKKIMLLVGILVSVQLLILAYIVPVLVDKADSPAYLFVTGITAIIINVVFVLSFNHYIRVSNRIRENDKEKKVIEQIEGYDKDYFNLIQLELRQTRFIRHDLTNYIEQIKALTDKGDKESLELAQKVTDELMERLNVQSVEAVRPSCNN